MIFSRLFSKKHKWQAKDSNVRIAAINEELSLHNSDEKQVLLSLLSEDESELVRRAALLKLNDFNVYLSSSNSNDNVGIKKFSSSQINAILTDNHDINLTTEEKKAFIKQPTSEAFLMPWLESEQSPTLVSTLFTEIVNYKNNKKNTAHLFSQLFAQKQTSDVQMELLSLSIPELADETILTKLLKKSASSAVSEAIENKLFQLSVAKEAPIKLQKQLQLVLSKLLALKDNSNYSTYLTKRNNLEVQWQQGLKSISCLEAEQQQILEQKHQKITDQLTQLFAPRAEAYQQDIITQQLLVKKQQAIDEFTTAIADINQVITTCVFEDQSLDQPVFDEQLTELENNVKHSVLNESDKSNFIKQLSALAKRLNQLPEIAASVSEATHLISKISQLSLPQVIDELNDRQNTYNDWVKRWKMVERQASGILPQSIKDAHSEITMLWRQGLKPLQAEQQKTFNQTKKKLIDIKRLLLNGKYKVCFGLFKGVKQSFPLLSVQQQQQLQRDFDHVSEKIAEISDWEHYIATPRKQQLLEEISSLIELPLDNPNDQADKVKQFRKTWNSLGHADESIDKALNDQFNQACEQAFAPCRLFYAEQEKLRGQHLIERKNIIEQSIQMAKSFTENLSLEQSEKEKAANFKLLDGQLNKLQQTWNQTGEVDRKEYQRLQQEFKQTLAPVKLAIKAFHESNRNKKQALIHEAQAQLVVEDVYQAIEKVKQLQQQWRDIGFAGSRQENKFWQDFRQVNDQIFAKREQINSIKHDAQTVLVAQFTQGLNDIKGTLDGEPNKLVLNKAKQLAEALLAEVRANKPVLKAVVIAIESFLENTQTQLVSLEQQETRANWFSLFTLLKKLAASDNINKVDEIIEEPDFKQLNSFWQKRLHEQLSFTHSANDKDRNTKTLVIEILSQVESPSEYAQQRMAAQVKLMQEQMSSGAEIDLTSELLGWLKLGKITSQDLVLIQRLEKAFLK